MAGELLLPERFIYAYCACHGNIQALNNTYLRNNKITISHSPYFITHTVVLIAKTSATDLPKSIS